MKDTLVLYEASTVSCLTGPWCTRKRPLATRGTDCKEEGGRQNLLPPAGYITESRLLERLLEIAL